MRIRNCIILLYHLSTCLCSSINETEEWYGDLDEYQALASDAEDQPSTNITTLSDTNSISSTDTHTNDILLGEIDFEHDSPFAWGDDDDDENGLLDRGYKSANQWLDGFKVELHDEMIADVPGGYFHITNFICNKFHLRDLSLVSIDEDHVNDDDDEIIYWGDSGGDQDQDQELIMNFLMKRVTIACDFDFEYVSGSFIRGPKGKATARLITNANIDLSLRGTDFHQSLPTSLSIPECRVSPKVVFNFKRSILGEFVEYLIKFMTPITRRVASRIICDVAANEASHQLQMALRQMNSFFTPYYDGTFNASKVNALQPQTELQQQQQNKEYVNYTDAKQFDDSISMVKRYLPVAKKFWERVNNYADGDNKNNEQDQLNYTEIVMDLIEQFDDPSYREDRYLSESNQTSRWYFDVFEFIQSKGCFLPKSFSQFLSNVDKLPIFKRGPTEIYLTELSIDGSSYKNKISIDRLSDVTLEILFRAIPSIYGSFGIHWIVEEALNFTSIAMLEDGSVSEMTVYVPSTNMNLKFRGGWKDIFVRANMFTLISENILRVNNLVELFQFGCRERFPKLQASKLITDFHLYKPMVRGLFGTSGGPDQLFNSISDKIFHVFNSLLSHALQNFMGTSLRSTINVWSDKFSEAIETQIHQSEVCEYVNQLEQLYGIDDFSRNIRKRKH